MVHFRGRSIMAMVLFVLLMCMLDVRASSVHGGLMSSTFSSPMIELPPGMVSNRIYFGVDFPKGHIGVKSFDAELVYSDGRPVPLYNTYLHHWVMFKYFQRSGAIITEQNYASAMQKGDIIFSKIGGLCQGITLQEYWGLGSETRKTATFIPDPYAIETGNAGEVPSGYEEKWALNVHAIDTRGVLDKRGCLECRCDLYNVTADTDGKPLPAGYVGGLKCCGDKYQCRLGGSDEHDDHSHQRIYLRYKVRWVEWEASILPVKIFILDVTDTGARNSSDENVGCKVEYQVPACKQHRGRRHECEYRNRTSLVMPTGGYLIYGVGHLHVGGRSTALFRKDGREICTSKAVYGRGKKAGDEEGYVVGMSTCYPKPGSVRIRKNEVVVLESNYVNTASHSGVMGLFYMLVADKLPKRTM